MSNVRVTPGKSEGLLDGYLPSATHYDEVFRAPGEVRPTWRELLDVIEDTGRAELTRRWLQAQEEIHATGIAYNVYDESAGVSRPWELDLLPQLFEADEWSALAAGLRQRAELFNRILVDLYGSQELLTSGLLPAEWLYSHPAFRRVFHGQQPEGGTFLHFYAVDLARAPDGRWWVIDDRTDAPFGIGFALENRILTARMLSDAISSFRIERLASFFMTLQESLRQLAPTHRDNPRIVLLSHGPGGPSYFEDAYLARYLGYTLVEGGDLAVRDDHVCLKTLSGLLPVDVVFRRMSDQYCDPVELGSQPELGVPGLLQSARLGKVAVVNALGSSLVESPALLPFLPGIARQWLGCELQLPSVATWWTGQQEVYHQLLALLDRPESSHSLRSAYRLGRMESVPPIDVRTETRPEILQRLAGHPEDWIVQEAVQRSTSPVWCDGAASRWHVALRVYLVRSKTGYDVMPGGLVRLAQDPRDLDTDIFGGKVCQDAWVRSAGQVQHVTLLATANQPVVLRRSGAELPSRVADNLFWFGRHLERAQGACRLLRAVVGRLTGEREAVSVPEMDYLVRCLAVQGQIEPGFALEGMREKLPAIASFLPENVLDELQPGSLRSLIAGTHRNASLVRDRLSLDTWRIVHDLERDLAQAVERSSTAVQDRETSAWKRVPIPFGLVELDELLDELLVGMAALDGMVAESMTRTPAWRFLDLGRRIERSVNISSLVHSLPGDEQGEEARSLEALLEFADSIMTYRGRYLAAVNRAAALDLLLTDETNPRSLAYQLSTIADHVANLPRDATLPLGTPEDRIASSLLHGVRMIDVEDLSHGGGDRTKLGRMLVRICDQLPKLSDLVSHRYLIHAGRRQQLLSARG